MVFDSNIVDDSFCCMSVLILAYDSSVLFVEDSVISGAGLLFVSVIVLGAHLKLFPN